MYRFYFILTLLFCLFSCINSFGQLRQRGCPGGMCMPAHYNAKSKRMGRQSMSMGFTSNYTRQAPSRGTNWSRGSNRYGRVKTTRLNERTTTWRRESRDPALLAYDPNDAHFTKERSVKRNRASQRALGKATSGTSGGKRNYSSRASNKAFAFNRTRPPKYKPPRSKGPKVEVGLWDPKMRDYQRKGNYPAHKKKKSKQKVKVKKLDPPVKEK